MFFSALKFGQDKFNQFSINLVNIFKNFKVLVVKHHTTSSVFGFFLVMTIIIQIVSGITLSFSLVPETMMISTGRDEEDMDVMHIDFLFWMHERGVDLLFILFYFHLFRKLYLSILYVEQEYTWKSGVLLLCFFQVVTFLGLVLCCTHLSDITLSIACNIFHTFFNFIGKPYSFIFTDKKLSCDTVIRLAYAHYLSAFILFYLGLTHAVCMHYDWKTDGSYDCIETDMVWYDEVMISELSSYFDVVVLLYLFGIIFYSQPEPLAYELFMWGDVGLVNDVRFYGVAPHWYFRPFMAWLTVCPFHKTGIFGLIFFFFLLYNQVSIKNIEKRIVTVKGSLRVHNIKNRNSVRYDFLSKIFFWVFVLCFIYTFTFLPAGRYYQQVYGNNGTLFAYFYIFLYLSCPQLHLPNNWLLFSQNIANMARSSVNVYLKESVNLTTKIRVYIYKYPFKNKKFK